MLEHLVGRCALGQFVDQSAGGVDQGLRGRRVGLLHGVHLHLRGGDAWITGAQPDLRLGLGHVLRRVVADVAVPALRPGPALELTEPVELRMGGVDVVGLVERLQCDLPVAVEVQPFAPLAPHVLQTERVEDLRGRVQVVLQRFAVGVHVDPQPAAPGVDLHRAQVGVGRCQRALPVRLLADVGARAVQTVCPAVESADEGLARPAEGVARAHRGVDQFAAAVHAHVVVCGEIRSRRVGPGPHDDDRVVEDVVGQVAADLRKLLDPADLLPDLAPQPIPFGPSVFRRDVGLDGHRHRLRQFFDIFHQILRMAARKDSSFRKSDVLSAPRWLHLRSRPPSTSSVWPVM